MVQSQPSKKRLQDPISMENWPWLYASDIVATAGSIK
jgi:hypothetical protein